MTNVWTFGASIVVLPDMVQRLKVERVCRRLKGVAARVNLRQIVTYERVHIGE